MPKWTDQPPYPYCIAFVVWMILTVLEQFHPLAIYIVDPIKTFVTGLLVVCEWHRLPALGRIRWGESAMVGLMVFGLLVVLSPVHDRHLTREIIFNPFDRFGSGDTTYGLYCFHLLGMVIVAPIVEEVFWRGFFMRYLIRKEFQSVTMGVCTPLSFLVTTLLIALGHGAEWPKALAIATVLGLWFVYTRSLGNVMAAHTIGNLSLGIYVLLTKSWWLW